MGNEQHIVPISWQVVSETIFPALADLLSRRPPSAAFVERWRRSVPPQRAAGIADDPFADWREQIPPGYLEDIGWSLGLNILPASALRRSPAHQQLVASGGAWSVTSTLQDLLVSLAGTPLPGPSQHDDTYWGRLVARPDLHVAGAKWSWRFLEALYEVAYVPYDPTHGNHSAHYTYQRRGVVGDDLYELLDALFLSARAFPGTRVARAATWELAGCIPGYLLPREVRDLARWLDTLAALPQVGHDEHFKLLADRVRRSARGWAALVTILE